MTRRARVGVLDVKPEGVVETLLIQEMMRARSALIAIEETMDDRRQSPAAKCMQAQTIARLALNDGEAAMGGA